MINMNFDNLTEWKETVGNIAVLVTLVQFLSGSIVCIKYVKNRSTGDTSGFAFVTGFLSCSLWLKYGLLKNDNIVTSSSLVGTILFFIYIVIYHRIVTVKKIIVYQFLSICLLLCLFQTYLAFEEMPLVALNRTGLVSCIVSLIFIASPLTMLLHVFRVRSTETLPFPIILTSFLVSAIWLLYGLITEDAYMKIPNALGAIISAFQLSLFLFLPSTTTALPQYNKLRQVA